MDEQQKWKSIAAGVGAVALVAMSCAIYGCSQDKKSSQNDESTARPPTLER